MRYIYLLILTFLLLPKAYAQKENNIWYMGIPQALDFNTSPPSLLPMQANVFLVVLLYVTVMVICFFIPMVEWYWIEIMLLCQVVFGLMQLIIGIMELRIFVSKILS